jgi:hypothetical protein
LVKIYDEDNYEEPIIMVGLRHEEGQKEIEHERKLDVDQSKKDNDKGKEPYKPESSNHKGDRK